MIGFVHVFTRRGIFFTIIGSRKTVPPRIFRIVPFGDFHIFFSLNSVKQLLQEDSTIHKKSPLKINVGIQKFLVNIPEVWHPSYLGYPTSAMTNEITRCRIFSQAKIFSCAYNKRMLKYRHSWNLPLGIPSFRECGIRKSFTPIE